MGTHSRVGCHRIRRSNEFYAQHGYMEAPTLAQWMATLRCGLCCEHCLAVSRESGFSDMPLEKVHGLIDEVASMGVREFLVTGGEPLAREDLGEVIEHLGRSGVSWTLNTAAMPTKALREAIERNKPGFVAVSLDGPKAVHDAFRGRAGAWDDAMEAIRFFKSLGTVRVCAGTTVTSRNYDYLDETFHLVTTSGADQWGIHLLVPEGRAADRPDLFLSKTQLKRLIKFVARRRRQFHVQMADEIGYLGYLEPLVRDVPMACGAGRSQCVVLPDGEVVPCTTLDRSCSAGNVHDRSLQAIWAEGFAELRAWRPNGKCGGCEYAVACKGGCWLQRKAGTQCFKEVWHVPEALKTAAGIAICLGGLAAPNERVSPASAGSVLSPAGVIDHAVGLLTAGAAQTWSLDTAINAWYFHQATGTYALSDARNTPELNDPIWEEVAWRFFRDLAEDALPQDITERCARVREVLETEERSLSAISLLWRAVNGPLFEAGNTQEYSQEQRQTISATLAAIKEKSDAWRAEIFEYNLDPYLSEGRVTAPSAGVPLKSLRGSYAYDTRYYLFKDLNEERWGAAADPETREAAQAYMQAHRYAEQMDLGFNVLGISGALRPSLVSAGGGFFEPNAPLDTVGANTMGPFDVLAIDRSIRVSFQIKGDIKAIAPQASDRNEGSLLDDDPAQEDVTTTVSVTLNDATRYTYTELLNVVHEQNRLTLLAIAYDWLSANTVGMWDQNVPVVTAVYENGALLWPAIREIIESDTIIPTGGQSGNATREFTAEEIAEIHRRGVLKDIDFWMF
ncbi:MAG: radical SAM protein [Phycisphaerales bacterium]